MAKENSKIKSILNLAQTRLLLLDGGIGTGLSSKCDSYSELLNSFNPSAVAELHLSYIRAGADFVTTNSFRANSISLTEVQNNSKIIELNKKAVTIPQDVIAELDDKRTILVTGAISPIVGEHDLQKIKESYVDQITALVSAGVDLIMLETFHLAQPLLIALQSVAEVLEKQQSSVGIWVSVVLDQKGNFLGDAIPIQRISKEIQVTDLFAIGLNCVSATEDIVTRMRILSEIAGPALLSLHPNAGLPDSSGVYPVKPEQFANLIQKFHIQVPLNIVGGCCGTTAEYISYLKKELTGLAPRQLES